ncbi:MAG: hypothetical protein PF444_05690 [Bacteroidales bacterium]|jgi:hypothetical protein|nr:hypothetical protein [Bacteroidales bacterium]
MKAYLLSLLLIISTGISAVSDSVMFQGQVSAYANYNPSNTMDLGTGGRLIPQLNYELYFDDDQLVDFEGSLNAYGNTDFPLFDSLSLDGHIKPYRVWGRYSTQQLEIRVGLQKIDFGQATLLRPLRWFDSVDPRDPLGISDGVYGGLMRYYFLNNANVWLWGLYGNAGLKGLEFVETYDASFEYGGRVQSPLLSGEVGLSYHHRTTNIGTSALPVKSYENRVGFDARWDMVVGAYIEGAWMNQSANVDLLNNQEFLTLGVDYTFGIGAGLYTVVEHMVIATGEDFFVFDNSVHMTALQMSYPIGMFDNLGTIAYYDWNNNDTYLFINWFRQYDQMTFYLMTYFNPEKALISLPGVDSSQNLSSGNGVQAMIVFNF